MPTSVSPPKSANHRKSGRSEMIEVQRLFGVAILWTMSLLPVAVAQSPARAQVGAVWQACRADYQAYCSGVPTGGSAALACLQQNERNLSGACRQAVAAASGASPEPAVPAAVRTAEQPPPDTWPHTITAAD